MSDLAHTREPSVEALVEIDCRQCRHRFSLSDPVGHGVDLEAVTCPSCEAPTPLSERSVWIVRQLAHLPCPDCPAWWTDPLGISGPYTDAAALRRAMEPWANPSALRERRKCPVCQNRRRSAYPWPTDAEVTPVEET